MQDAERLEGLAKELSSPSDLKPATEGTELQKVLGGIAERAQGGTDFLYTKFFAIGLFRLLELTGRTAALACQRAPRPACSDKLDTLLYWLVACKGRECHTLLQAERTPKHWRPLCRP